MLETSARRPTARPVTRGWRRTTQGVACLVVLALAAAGCSDDEATAPKPDPTPLASLNTTSMEVPRIEFCGLVPDAAVRDALDAKPDDDSSYGNGDEVELSGVGEQVVHEIGCEWSTDDGAAARAWVFARPVDVAFARTAFASSRRTKGCEVDRRQAYGRPSVTQTCRLTDGTTRVRHAGLFRQTWLTCEVASADPANDVASLRERSDRWCVEVVNALNTGS